MKINDIAIDRRITVYVVLLLILVTGVYSYVVLPRESNPEVVIPIILVQTVYEGVTPSDMESLVTIPIERKLTGLAGVKKIESTSSQGLSVISIEFEAAEDIDVALQRVRDKVDQAKQDLPADAEDPQIQEINISEFPVMYLSLTGDVGLALMTKIAEDLEDELESIRGVLDVRVIGGIEREIQIVVDPVRATEFGISMADLVLLAQVENVNTPAGAMELGDARFSVRVPGEFTGADEIRDLVVKAGPDGVVYMRDIAEVYDGFKEMETRSRVNGREAVTLTVTKRAGANVISVTDEVMRALDQFRDRLLPGMDIEVTTDQSVHIRDMVSELENSILSGLILVLTVIFIFLGFSNAIMVALAIPISMLITFTVLYITDTTLNFVVLFSLILALGMLVDNGIVVVENIFRHVQQGMAPVEAAKRGADEVALPIISSTMTTICAFVPLFFWPGIWGSFMFFLPQTVSLALLASLFVGLVVNPALASVFMHFSPRTAQREERKHHFTIRFYAFLLRKALRWRAVTLTMAVSALVILSALFMKNARVEFTPDTEPSEAYVDIDCAEGARLEFTDDIVRQVESVISEYQDHLKFVIANVGSRGVSAMGGGGTSSHIGRVKLDFPRLGTTDMLPSVIIREVREKLEHITGAELRVRQSEHGPPPKPPVNVEISGEDFDLLADLAVRVRERIHRIPGLVGLRDDYERGRPEIRVTVDRQQALLMGLNTRFIGQAVQAAINGRKAGVYREGDKEYDVIVRFPREFRENLTNLEAMTLVNLQGTVTPFSSVARIEQGAGLGTIKRINRKRTVTVSAEVQGRTGPEVLGDVQAALEGFPLPTGYTIAYTGEKEEQQEAQAFLGRAFVVALFLIALVLVSQFNSIFQSLIIMTSVILSLAGVFFGLFIHGLAFGVIMTGIGCISLAGVVVNNAIVMIDFINKRRRDCDLTHDAIVSGAITRFRPVMLTAVTTILGLIPMAIGVSFDFRNMTWLVGSESSQWWGPMAIAVIYGLAFATVLTLIVVPTLYSISISVHNFFLPREQRAQL